MLLSLKRSNTFNKGDLIMRRMIPGKLIDSVKKLSTSVSADGEGNLEVGKDLEVDGSFFSLGKLFFIDFENKFFTEHENPLGIAFEGADQESFYLVSYNNGEDISALGTSYDGASFILFNSDGSVKASYDILDSNNWSGYIKIYRHHLTLTTASGTDYQDYYSHSNLVVDSIQDLTTITGGHPFGSGTGYTYASNVWKHGSANVTAVADDVQLVTN